MGTIDLTGPRANTVTTFAIGTSSQQGAKISGIELSYEQPFGKTPFGFTANVSRAKTKAGDGRPMAGASESAGNLGLYFENDTLSSRLVANYRGEYVNSQRAFAICDAPTGLHGQWRRHARDTGDGSIRDDARVQGHPQHQAKPALTFDAINLTNTRRACVRHSEDKQQKLDVDGRQSCLNLKYKF